MTDISMHLNTDEIELWAQGLLPAARAMHLADCSLCRVEAERERKVISSWSSFRSLRRALGLLIG